MVSVFFQRFHMFAKCVVSSVGLRQYVCEKTVAHANTKKPFNFGFIRSGPVLTKALECRQEQHTAGGLNNFTTFHKVGPLNCVAKARLNCSSRDYSRQASR